MHVFDPQCSHEGVYIQHCHSNMQHFRLRNRTDGLNHTRKNESRTTVHRICPRAFSLPLDLTTKNCGPAARLSAERRQAAQLAAPRRRLAALNHHHVVVMQHHSGVVSQIGSNLVHTESFQWPGGFRVRFRRVWHRDSGVSVAGPGSESEASRVL